MTNAAPTSFVALLSLIATNVAGYTKKTTFAALFLIGYCVGNIIGPQTFRGTDYVPAEITIVVCQGLCLLDLGFIWWWCRRENTRKAALRAEPGYQKIENQVCSFPYSNQAVRYVFFLVFANLCRHRNGLISRIERISSLCILCERTPHNEVKENSGFPVLLSELNFIQQKNARSLRL